MRRNGKLVVTKPGISASHMLRLRTKPRLHSKPTNNTNKQHQQTTLTTLQPFSSSSSSKPSTWYPSTITRRANPSQVLGRVIHISVDAILVSAVLAGIKRSTGLQYLSLPCP